MYDRKKYKISFNVLVIHTGFRKDNLDLEANFMSGRETKVVTALTEEIALKKVFGTDNLIGKGLTLEYTTISETPIGTKWSKSYKSYKVITNIHIEVI